MGVSLGHFNFAQSSCISDLEQRRDDQRHRPADHLSQRRGDPQLRPKLYLRRLQHSGKFDYNAEIVF